MRRYDEPVRVDCVGPDDGGPGSQVPHTFTWRGRRYAVCVVLDRWVQRHPWWRIALADPDPDAPADLADPVVLEEEVYRVEARWGQRPPGVFDLARGAGWRLVRTVD